MFGGERLRDWVTGRVLEGWVWLGDGGFGLVGWGWYGLAARFGLVWTGRFVHVVLSFRGVCGSTIFAALCLLSEITPFKIEKLFFFIWKKKIVSQSTFKQNPNTGILASTPPYKFHMNKLLQAIQKKHKIYMCFYESLCLSVSISN